MPSMRKNHPENPADGSLAVPRLRLARLIGNLGPARRPRKPGEKLQGRPPSAAARQFIHLRCRRCRGEALEVVAGLFRARGLRLTPYGYNVATATELHVDDEIVQCLDCGETCSILRFVR